MTRDRPNGTLRVEGPNDLHVILHLLRRHQLRGDKRPATGRYTIDDGPEIIPAGNDFHVLDSIVKTVEFAGGKPSGFVIDANGDLGSRWMSISDRLKNVGLSPPPTPPTTGFQANVPQTGAAVGVWLMPDNQHLGAIEEFLHGLLKDDQRPIYDHAKAATEKARSLNAEFQEADRRKAELYCLLAWRDPPGRPFGGSVADEYFRHDTAIALSFVAWFKRLYRLP